MDQFADRLARLADLNPDELDALEAELVAAFAQADQSGDVDLMQQLADALDTVRAAKTATPPAEAAQAPAGQAAPVAAAAATPEEPDEPSEPDAPDDEPAEATTVQTDTPEEPEVPEGEPAEPEPGDPQPANTADEKVDQRLVKAVETVTEAVEEAQAVQEVAQSLTNGEPAAAADQDITPTEGQEQVAPDQQQEEAVATEVVTQEDVPDANKPVPVAAAAIPFTITAGGDIPGVTSGQRLADMDEVVDALTRKINTMRGVSGDGEYVVVASIRRDDDEVPEEKMLRRADPEGNAMKIRKFMELATSRESLVAAGWCAPRTPLYDIPGIGSTDTPVADSLPSFGVDRGGIVWTEPPSLGGVITSMAPNTFARWYPGNAAGTISQVGVVGNTPSVPPDMKPCIDIACGVERSSDLIALPLCLCFDLLSSRTNPEFVKASTDLVQVSQAHFKEQWLLAQMFSAPGVVNNSGGTTYGTPDVGVGVARDFLIQVRLVASQYRWRNRLSATQQLRGYFPNWLRDAIAADLMLQPPGDGTLSTSFAEVDGYLDDANVDAVWYIDDVPVMGAGTPPAGPNAATTAASNFDSYAGFPATAEWLLTAPGVFTRLDGGSLDLGVVRDMNLVQKNRFCEFAETFEQVAYMGPQNAAGAWAVRGTTPVKIIGGYACCVDTSAGVAVE
jgi:hypothetical protein